MRKNCVQVATGLALLGLLGLGHALLDSAKRSAACVDENATSNQEVDRRSQAYRWI